MAKSPVMTQNNYFDLAPNGIKALLSHGDGIYVIYL